jgi:8-oxo-dGTP pyrophosphatase MutT (NUDIX family)
MISERLRSQLISLSGDADTARARPKRRRIRGDHDFNPDLRPKPPFKPAAVLVPLIDRPEGITLLLTRRTDNLADHGGQICFPGGRLEEVDDSPEAAALREAEEEVGLPRQRVELMGRLDTYETRSRYAVVPVVGIVSPPFTLRPDPLEVAEAFEVPLAFILNPSNHEVHCRRMDGTVRFFYVFTFEGRPIWGATAGMLVNLYEALLDQC